MMADQLYDIRQPEAIFGLHVGPFESGRLDYRSGPMAAASDSFEIHVSGAGTHGAMPWGGTDSLSAAAQITTSLQSITSRRLDLRDTPAILSVGYLNSGNRNNVVPAEATLGGTIRSYNPDTRERIHQLMPKVANGIAASYDVSAETTIKDGYPVLYNDPELGERMRPTLERVIGGPVPEPALNTASEDFGLFTSDAVPGMYIGLGVAPNEGAVYPNHSPRFTLDEDALVMGVKGLSHLVVDFLRPELGSN